MTTETLMAMHQAGTSHTKGILKCIANFQTPHICRRLMLNSSIMFKNLENKDVAEASWAELRLLWTISPNSRNQIRKLHHGIAPNTILEWILPVELQKV